MSVRTLPWLGHPISLVALVVLVVNDHLLKAAWPGLVTGKLSDLAGLALAPPLLATLLLLAIRPARAYADRVALGSVVAVGVGFAAVKASEPVARAASAAWSVLNGQVRADLTDLVALPALALSWYAWRRTQALAPTRTRSRAGLALLLPLALVGAAASGITNTATTQWPTPRYDVAVGVGPGQGDHVVVLVARRHADGGAVSYVPTAASPNGYEFDWYASGLMRCGDSFEFTDDDPPPCYEAALLDRVRLPAHPRACGEDELTCYRVVPGRLAIEESADGGETWRTAWEIPDATRDTYAAKLAEVARDYDVDYSGDIDEDLSCVSLVVLPNSTVFAACGLIGFVRNDGFGTWETIGFHGYHTVDLDQMLDYEGKNVWLFNQ